MAPEQKNNKELSPEVQSICDDYWNWRMSDSPEFATMVGNHDYDDRLDDLSLEAHRKRYDQCQAFLKRAEALEPSLKLHEDSINIRVLKTELQTYIDGFPFQGFLLPVGFSEGVHLDFGLIISYMVLKEAADYEKLISRYEQLPTQLNQILDLLKKGVATGVVHHQRTMKGVGESIGKCIVSDAEKSPLWKPFTTFPENFTKELISSFQDRAKHLIIQQISPGFKRLRDYIEKDYVTRPNIAANSLPDGDARYRQLLRFHTSTNLTAAEIHQKGLDEVARIEVEMAKIVKDLGYNMTVSEFSAKIRNDPSSYHANPDDLMVRLKEIVYDIIDPKLKDIFTNIPKTEMILKPSPSSEGVLGYYLAGTFDGSRPGVFYVNTQLYASLPKYDMLTLSLHEGSPGHHLQFSYSIESPTMPFFRRVMEDRNYQLAPSRFPINTGFLEGWGLYSEKLGFDMDLFKDPYDRYGHYSFEIFRACRLVVDTGMHAFNWTRQRAIDYMLAHTAVATKNIENEVDRYITFPGQAVGYKVGELKIRELRERSHRKLGDAFDLRKFHSVVLESVGPLEILEEEIEKWIEAGGQLP